MLSDQKPEAYLQTLPKTFAGLVVQVFKLFWVGFSATNAYQKRFEYL